MMLGNNVHLHGQVGVAQHLKIGDNVRNVENIGLTTALAPALGKAYFNMSYSITHFGRLTISQPNGL
ncbi:uncharacterized protein CCR75_009222 [Bremia lactucae]|uniref:Uncharacterized protein n=1 Tax=Bremia lactucae TaxID=4779 RepID=A0A976IHT1_BRELC|nr:hypothetical protein CCR75_009222 [Bremia lactucae]